MRTRLSQFCEEFDGTVRPILEPLQRAAQSLTEASRRLEVRGVLPTLLDLRHQLQALVDKVAEQQAYVLIFGPLKSGKSTLMNAMSAAYVSEVTCLPAYPCMVYVSHSSTRKYEITSYNGDVKGFTDPTAMRRDVIRAHGELADKIREIEGQASDDFDPSVHWPQAIRKVDVKVPAGALESSGAVLVDTPGLYSRMKFGYDRMTRDFRNAAACAIFVVKTDNLFLEQVFEEFTELLELFSRIFLVVNIDSTKRDLRPDGTLAPSLEHDAPERVIEAFETLAMSAPLKAAAEEGRLEIYPVDLLQAASRRVLESNGDPVESTPQNEAAGAGFDAFITDLTDYLNSTDYLVAFLGDSLTRADNLCREIGQVCEHESLRKLADRMNELRNERALALTQSEVLERLDKYDWHASFDALRAEMVDKSRGPLTDVRTRSEDEMSAAIDAWFDGDDSLQSLLSPVGEVLGRCGRDLGTALRDALTERVRLGSAGLVLPEQLSRDLEAGLVGLDGVGRRCVEALDARPGPAESGPLLRTMDVPVKKGFWDYVLLRGQARMRKRIFGASESPTKRIPKSLKQRRLGTAAREALVLKLDEVLDQRYRRDVEGLTRQLFGDYSDAVVTEMKSEIESKRAVVTQRLEDLEQKLAELERVLRDVKDLAAESSSVGDAVEELQSRYAETSPTDLIQPVRRLEEGEAEVEVAGEAEAQTEAEGTETAEADGTPPEVPDRKPALP